MDDSKVGTKIDDSQPADMSQTSFRSSETQILNDLGCITFQAAAAERRLVRLRRDLKMELEDESEVWGKSGDPCGDPEAEWRWRSRKIPFFWGEPILRHGHESCVYGTMNVDDTNRPMMWHAIQLGIPRNRHRDS